jgi:hypothetical protein
MGVPQSQDYLILSKKEGDRGVEKEVQDTSCWGLGGIPQFLIPPRLGDKGGSKTFINTLFKISIDFLHENV